MCFDFYAIIALLNNHAHFFTAKILVKPTFSAHYKQKNMQNNGNKGVSISL